MTTIRDLAIGLFFGIPLAYVCVRFGLLDLFPWDSFNKVPNL